jgi:hypothetical protein
MGKAGTGIEPVNSGFADRGLTTWLPRRMSLSEPIRRLLPFTPHGARRQFCQFRKLCEPGRLSGQGLRIILYAGHKGSNVTSMDGKSTGRGNACTSSMRSTAAKKSRLNSRNGGESSRADCAFQQKCFRRCRFLSVAWIIKQFECFRRQMVGHLFRRPVDQLALFGGAGPRFQG